MIKRYCKISLCLMTLIQINSSFAAETIDLAHLPFHILQTINQTTNQNDSLNYHQTSTHLDQNNVSHIRLQQTWAGYPVWGGDAILHVPHQTNHPAPFTTLLAHPTEGTRITGTAYLKLQTDLISPPSNLFTPAHSEQVLQKIIASYKQQMGTHLKIEGQSIKGMVYVDKTNKAHWAWFIQFKTHSQNHPPAIPTFILDATTDTLYQQWDNLQTVFTRGGGYGGNPHMGKLVYDGLSQHLPELTIDRDDDTQMCYLSNDEVIVKDRDQSKGDTISRFYCPKPDNNHNQTYWDNHLNSVNGGYSPDNDALFIGHIVQKLYNDWYGIPALMENNQPMKLIMRVHDYESPDNAFWDGEQMTFSDGGDEFYPFTILSIGAHEISHGFTEQHANLIYENQSGGLNESFSDMASAAANYYLYGKNNWQLGQEISKLGNGGFRYMDLPSKDCYGREPGHHCSIDKASQYVDRMNVHFSSGVFNRAFYLLATSSGWDIHKAFNVMVKANQDYWVPTSTFQQAACGAINAAKDLNYDVECVINALLQVDIDISVC